MIELKIKICDIDYDALAELMTPMIIEHMKGSGGFLGGILSAGGGAAAGAAKAFFKKLPREKKDELAVSFLNGNSYKIRELLENEGAKNGFKFSVADAEAKRI